MNNLENISAVINAFQRGDLKENALKFFNTLGYQGQRTLDLSLTAFFPALDQEKALVNYWKNNTILFQLTSENLERIQSLITAVDNTIIQSYLFIAIELNKNLSKKEIIQITRELNKHSLQPILILFVETSQLTLSIIHRRLHKQNDQRDVLEKVTLLKDIRISNPHRAHLEILNDLTLSNLTPIPHNFVELHQRWQRVLDTKELNKKFYKELSVLFTQLVGGERGKIIYQPLLKLPSIINEKILKEFAVRLIGRLLFCWFLQKKTSTQGLSLIPSEILSFQSLKEKSPDLDFYHSVLEPLFFEILNKELIQRKPKFQTKKWGTIPFLNGGLFDPHLYDFYDNSCTLNTLIVPDDWLGELLKFFERYHFTIEENTPLEEDVALDPELLGQIFENLLAEINPETGETARKLTGSYYTPREIVDYMVDESLIAYFLNFNLEEQKIRKLLNYQISENVFNVQETDILLKAIKQIKILDPACGSGAFPIGILHKLTLLLQKLDPDCSKWLDAVLGSISDSFTRQMMKDKLEGEKALWNYTRKLGILRDCIYGIDIQPIAIEIGRLRCFLSLVVEENIDDQQKNRGVIPLPNLDFKFVCANTLIGSSHLDWQLYESQTRDQVDELAKLRKDYLNSQAEEKTKLQTKFETVQKSLLDIVLQWTGKETELSQLVTWKPFGDQSCDWFDLFWMFGIKDGFDIVIGNPPYIRQEAIKHLKADLKHFTVFTGTSDLFTYFYEASFNFLKENGVLAFITSNKWMRAKYGEKLREFFLTKTQLLQLIDFKGKQIFEATVDSNILLFKKQLPVKETLFLTGENLPTFEKSLKPLAQSLLNKKAFVLGDESVHELKAKIEAIGTPLKEWDVKIYRGILTGFNEAFIIDTATKERLCAEDPKNTEIIKPVLRGRDIKRYGYEWAGLWLINSHNNPSVDIEQYSAIKKHLDKFYPQLEKRLDKGKTPYNLRNCAYLNEFEKEKIVWLELTDNNKFAIDKNNYILAGAFLMTGKFSAKYLLTILNSSIINWLFDDICNSSGVGTNQWKKFVVEQIPIPKISESEQQPFIELVDKILLAKQQGNETRELENEIDAMVFDLYELSEEETLNILSEIKTSEADRRDIQAFFRRLQRAKS